MRTLSLLVPPRVLGALALVAASACALPSPDDARHALADAVFADLACDGVARPSTLQRLRAALDAPSLETLGALVTDPADLATVVSLAGPEVEALVLLANNAQLLATDGPVRSLVLDGWDGVSCDEPVGLGCTSGEAAGVVQCDGESAEAMSFELARCTLGGTVLDGGVAYTRASEDGTAIGLAFDALALDEVDVVNGALTLEIAADGALAAQLGEQGLSVVKHGGVDAGLACGASLHVAAFALSTDASGGWLAFDAVRADADGQLAVRTLGDGLRTSEDCACPAPGSGLYVDVPRPLGIDGAVAGASITYGPPADARFACADVAVELSDWPKSCLGGGDCGRAATETVLATMIGASCLRL